MLLGFTNWNCSDIKFGDTMKHYCPICNMELTEDEYQERQAEKIKYG